MFTHNIEISRYCHSDGRKNLAVPLTKSQCEMLRFAQHDTNYWTKQQYYY